MASERPFQRKGIGGVAHGDHNAAGANVQRLPADGVLVLELEVVLHLPRGQGVLLLVLALGDGEDDEEGRREGDAGDRGNRLGEEVHDGRGQQHQEHADEADGDFGFADADVGRNHPVSTPSSATRSSTPVEPIIEVLMAPDRMRKPTITTKMRNAMRSISGPTMYIARPAIRLSW